MRDERIEDDDVDRWLAGEDLPAAVERRSVVVHAVGESDESAPARDDRAEIGALGVMLLTKRETEAGWTLESARIVNRQDFTGRHGAISSRVLAVIVLRGLRGDRRVRLTVTELRRGRVIYFTVHGPELVHWRDALDRALEIGWDVGALRRGRGASS